MLKEYAVLLPNHNILSTKVVAAAAAEAYLSLYHFATYEEKDLRRVQPFVLKVTSIEGWKSNNFYINYEGRKVGPFTLPIITNV